MIMTPATTTVSHLRERAWRVDVGGVIVCLLCSMLGVEE
jgi:hypothetical protein